MLHAFPNKSIAEEQVIQQQAKGSNSLEVLRALSGYSWFIIFVGVFLMGTLWFFVRYQINADYDRTIAEASKETMNLAQAFEEHVQRVIADADNDLSSLKQACEQDGISSPLVATFVKNEGNNSACNQVFICNEQGIVVASFNKRLLARDFSNRECFQIQRNSATDILYIGKPIKGRVTGKTTIPLSRRINKPDGSFGGIVIVGLKTDYFSSFYKNIDLGADQSIALIGMDGFIRVRQSNVNLEGGLDFKGSPLWKNIKTGRLCGTYVANSILDGINRVFSYRVLPDYPLAVSVGESTRVALAPFEKRKQSNILGASLFSLLLLITCGLLVSRNEKQRSLNARLEAMVYERTREVEAQREALQAQNDNLETLVKERTEEVLRLDRLNLIGEMAASIGHEVRNPLTTVRGYLQMFQRKESNAEYHEQINTMIEELDRANSIITEFLSLAKDKRIAMKPTYLNAAIRKILPLLETEAIREGKEIITSFGNVPKVTVDEDEIRQCILNLTRNALDAVGTGGIVTICTEWDRQNTVCLSISDNGTGISPDVLKTIGKPFVTTKENGTGLGLPVCYRVADRHGAKINVETSPQGTTFTFEFKV